MAAYVIPIKKITLTPNFFFQDMCNPQMTLCTRMSGISSSVKLTVDDARPNAGILNRQYRPGINTSQFPEKGVQLTRSIMNMIIESRDMAAPVAYHDQLRYVFVPSGANIRVHSSIIAHFTRAIIHR